MSIIKFKFTQKIYTPLMKAASHAVVGFRILQKIMGWGIYFPFLETP